LSLDLDLDDDQAALRDGIAALLVGRFDSDRVRRLRPRDVRRARGGRCVRVSADGFAWADTVVVFEQLGRHCIPGPLVACLLAGRGNRGIAGIVERTGAPRRYGSRISTSSKCSTSSTATW
jgi:hypothetical protein